MRESLRCSPSSKKVHEASGSHAPVTNKKVTWAPYAFLRPQCVMLFALFSPFRYVREKNGGSRVLYETLAEFMRSNVRDSATEFLPTHIHFLNSLQLRSVGLLRTNASLSQEPKLPELKVNQSTPH